MTILHTDPTKLTDRRSPIERRIDTQRRFIVRKITVHPDPVPFGNRAFSELARQYSGGTATMRDDNKPRRGAVQPMHDERRSFEALLGQSYDRAVIAPFRSLRPQAARLVPDRVSSRIIDQDRFSRRFRQHPQVIVKMQLIA